MQWMINPGWIFFVENNVLSHSFMDSGNIPLSANIESLLSEAPKRTGVPQS